MEKIQICKHKLVLLRDGEGLWGPENKIKGWIDLELSSKGIIEAKNSSTKLRNFEFNVVHTSYLRRAIKTWNIIAEEISQHHIPVHKSWRLNERHFGVLQGIGEKDCAKRFGDDQMSIWKRSYDGSPPEIDRHDPKHPRKEEKYRDIPRDLLPDSEVSVKV
jgi:2,3-bisphosphoglycerate-dependent phosphoglycerate mutase